MVTTTEQYFQDADLFEQFLQDRTEEGADFFESTEVLFREWSQYCELRGYKDKITIDGPILRTSDPSLQPQLSALVNALTAKNEAINKAQEHLRVVMNGG